MSLRARRIFLPRPTTTHRHAPSKHTRTHAMARPAHRSQTPPFSPLVLPPTFQRNHATSGAAIPTTLCRPSVARRTTPFTRRGGAHTATRAHARVLLLRGLPAGIRQACVTACLVFSAQRWSQKDPGVTRPCNKVTFAGVKAPGTYLLVFLALPLSCRCLSPALVHTRFPVFSLDLSSCAPSSDLSN